MKVLLKQDVHGTGKAGDIVNVSDGYANNFLIPRKLAVPADAQTINSANIRKEAAKHRVEVQRKNARALTASRSMQNAATTEGCLAQLPERKSQLRLRLSTISIWIRRRSVSMNRSRRLAFTPSAHICSNRLTPISR